ncbi:ribulokinase [Maribacter sp.]|uniref:ribulokinase n=1 Tax=Maribacter sp. TaxID=1897614 RepID=UPI0025B96C56|nr:ribulokinase [Maribacter sp.]
MNKKEEKYTIGIDYGTDSARAVIINTFNGDEIASSVKYYPRWMDGQFCNPLINQYRQHPLDYIQVLEETVTSALSKAPKEVAKNVVGMSFDTTGSTPILTNENGIPLALLPEFEENPNAMFVLWKDHTAIKEAAEINSLVKKWKVDYTKYEGGIYSSEWVWAKMLHVLRNDEKVQEKAICWIEHCDWMPALITGTQSPLKTLRSRCAAGHKAMWHPDWEGLPPESFLTAIDPLLKGMRKKLYSKTYASDTKVGNLTAEWAKRLGLTTNVAVGVGAFDCHMGAVASQIEPNVLVKSIGTSTCDIMIASYNEIGNKLIPGICGQVDGSVIPGYIGLEAGQSAFGDIYSWFKKVLIWPAENILGFSELIDKETKQKLIEEMLNKMIPKLSEAAAKIPIEESTILAIDWLNGRRSPDASQEVKGVIAGLTLGTSTPHIFRALVEATAFGSKAIMERFEEEDIYIKKIIGLGGVAKKSQFVMQTLANVLNKPISIASTEQACAHGAAMFASVVAGVYEKVEDAQKNMGKGVEKTYLPNVKEAKVYELIYEKYKKLGAVTHNL